MDSIYKLFSENYITYNYVDLGSLTKFIVLQGFLNCIKDYSIKPTDYVYNIINYQHKDIKYIDIINHTSGLEYEKTQDISKFYNSKNINNFSMNLDRKKELIGNYNYNNYSYNILSYTIYYITGKHIDEYLEETILKDIDYDWYKINKIPIAGFGLYIYNKDMDKFLLQLKDYIIINNYCLDTFRFNDNLYVGDSTFYYCRNTNCFYGIKSNVLFTRTEFKKFLTNG